MRDTLSRASPEAEADYVVSTIHRAKELEWNRVKVCGDFRFKTDDDGRTTLTDEEKRLLERCYERFGGIPDAWSTLEFQICSCCCRTMLTPT
ncbi:hypothetical protein BCAR13_1840004 [Paraburkholderia caribensis]|uniref:hypothetical protein n=1 Tax=Paraburkholderia caribensis TaxID=75105 RepID=UPI001CADB94E|nr:hypothetical protein [Paraburkholderia caribensis]CAG9209293.1 hypothetical protein BCAR13_1840004 [Paraburkholderia caribensis]